MLHSVEILIQNDLPSLHVLQPEGWPDILPYYNFYLNADFCTSVKIEIDDKVVAIGTAIQNKQTAWLGHIIVHPDYRRQGLGAAITRHLIDYVSNLNYKTIFLLATKLGEPVYKKLGFEKETEYIGYKQENMNALIPPNDSILFQEQFTEQIFKLDLMATGESREHILYPHLKDAKLIIENNNVKGFYLPTLGEGLIVASTVSAGKKLLMIKLAAGIKTALPVDNKDGNEFLLQNGLKEVYRGSKMRLGEKINAVREFIYSRIGGNLG